jgi:hypothetical protein
VNRASFNPTVNLAGTDRNQGSCLVRADHQGSFGQTLAAPGQSAFGSANNKFLVCLNRGHSSLPFAHFALVFALPFSCA